MTPDRADHPGSIDTRIAGELSVSSWQVSAAVALLDGGATVPFVARYRKEVTGSLDDEQLRTLTERLDYLRELEDRRAAVIDSITAQGKLTPELAAKLTEADTKARLEDIYLPYKPKRRTRAQIAREAGLEPLADLLIGGQNRDPSGAAADFVSAERGIADGAAALLGARSILVERFGEDADLVGGLRELLWSRGQLTSTLRDPDARDATKFADYFEFSQPLKTLPSHRVLAMFRGESLGVLSLAVTPDSADSDNAVTDNAVTDNAVTDTAGDPALSDYERRIAARFRIADRGRPADRWLLDTVRWAWRTRLLGSLGIDLRGRLRDAAERAAAAVFAANLRDLLLAAPAGSRTTLGLDPGFRTGVKVAVVDATGKAVATDTIYPHQPANRWAQSLDTLVRLVLAYQVELVAIGNGTASRETDRLAADLVARCPGLIKIVVSEAGASVYSASAYATRELPGMDVSLRGAVSIARRLQDPLAELVKIDPKSIGVGQYQHDLSESVLARSLDAVVEDCVNAVGVEVNTASVPLLARVSGITTGLAENIVVHRDTNGPFRSRRALQAVPRLGPKAFEQCAGFLRIAGGNDPLDRSSVHPESYPVVRKILTATGSDIRSLIGNTDVLRGLSPRMFVDATVGLPTVTDILAELAKPGRDPRPAFTTAAFAEGVEQIADLRIGMILEGVVTNVAAFGAFVDVGVHQDGLVHVSAMARRFVGDPHEIVKSGQVVKVKVIQIDEARQRISLSLRLDDEPGQRTGAAGQTGTRGQTGAPGREGRPRRERPATAASTSRQDPRQAGTGGSMADALKRAGLGP